MANFDISTFIASGEWVGWVATALFAMSYIVKRPLHLLLLQATAGTLWIVYAIAIGALPVLIANGVVTFGALYKAQAIWREHKQPIL
jgi:polyferredoxin